MNEDTGLSCGRLKKKNTSLAYKWGFELIRSCERMIKDIYAMSGAFSMWLFAARFFQKSRFQIQNYPKVSQSIQKYPKVSQSINHFQPSRHNMMHSISLAMACTRSSDGSISGSIRRHSTAKARGALSRFIVTSRPGQAEKAPMRARTMKFTANL